jgi:pimeloyl-ACP methyl ester carboxylesterase
MTLSLRHSPPNVPASVPGQGGPRATRSRRRRFLGLTGVLAVALAALLAVSTGTNLVLERVEQASVTPYGHRVTIDGGALNVVQNGRAGSPLVLLSGLGTAAPGLDFAPLTRELNDFNVTVVEGFGYGYSDMSAGPRTVDSIATELHAALATLGIAKPYTLVGHSIAGFYTLYYANKYPDEVSAVIGIDTTVPSAPMGSAEPSSGGVNWERLLSTTGVVRCLDTLVPALAEPAGDAFTAGERERIRLMSSWNFGNAALSDETRRLGDNARAIQGMSYPADLPVLIFLSSESIGSLPHWRELHEEQVRNVARHELVELAGGHYLHWTQSPAMAEAIREFLGS